MVTAFHRGSEPAIPGSLLTYPIFCKSLAMMRSVGPAWSFMPDFCRCFSTEQNGTLFRLELCGAVIRSARYFSPSRQDNDVYEITCSDGCPVCSDTFQDTLGIILTE